MKDNMPCLHELFMQQARKTPDAVAAVDGDRRISYAELDRMTDHLAGYLQARGVTLDDPVGIFMEKSLEYIAAYIAILKAGGGYMPLDLEYPDALLGKILDEAQPKAVITKLPYADRLDDGRVPAILNIDSDMSWKECRYDKAAVAEITPDHLAYVVYSSGTTGEPKGILAPHRGSVHSYTTRFEISDYQPGDRVACNVFFVWELLRPLLRGGAVYVIPDEIIYDPVPLLDYIESNGITETLFTPSLLETVFNVVDTETVRTKFATMKVLWLNGEVVTARLRRRAMESLPPDVRLLNIYSISECHDVSVEDLRKFEALESGVCSVGNLMKGVTARLMDDNLQPVSEGAVGELFIGGPGLARGYLKKPELTAERFVELDGRRYYRTGDLAVIHPDGRLEIKGRCDYMVKVRGYSIHLGAVETALLENADVKSCAVIAEGQEGEDKRLVAYVVRNAGADWRIDPETGISTDLRERIKPHLAHYMVPSVFVEMDSIPLNAASGKLNRKQLPAAPKLKPVDFSDIRLGKSAGVGEQEAALQTIWERILGLKPGTIDRESDFFDYGGHSLLAVQMASAVASIFGTELRVKDVYETPVLKDMVAAINAGGTEGGPSRSIREDAVLDPAIRPDPATRPIPLSRAKKVFLTGSTGYLGGFLLDELLRETDADIYCLVREKNGDPVNARERIVNNLRQYKTYRKADEKRIMPVVGDLTRPLLGLSQEAFDRLADEIDFLFHCGSLVNYVYSYAVIRPAAVNGTEEVLRLASRTRTKPLHYISTNGVFPGGDKTPYMENREIDSFADRLEGGYCPAKWVAEKIVWEAIDRGLPVCLYRPGNIGHHSVTGVINENDFQALIVEACKKVQYAPDRPDWMFEMTPVDFLVKTIVTFAEKPAHFGNVYNVVESNPMPAMTVFEMLSASGFIDGYVSYDDWREMLYRTGQAENDPILNVLAQSLDDVEPYLSDTSVYDRTRLDRAISIEGIETDIPDKEYFRKLVDV